MTRAASTPVGMALVGLLILFGLPALSAPAHAQSRIQTALDTTLVTVGDRMTLTVTVEHAPEASVVWPDSLDLSPFEVLGADLAASREGDRVLSTARIQLAAFELGELELPSFSVDVLQGDGGRETLETDRFGVEVTTVGLEEGGDIREIRGPFIIPLSTITIALWVLVLLALLAGAFYGLRRVRRRSDAPEPERGPPPRPAHEIALEALRDVEGSNMLPRGQVKEYHIAISDALRRYVEARYRVPALEMTTWEIIEGLERVGVGGEFCGRLRSLLDSCDLVKFAKVRPDMERSTGVVREAIDLVEASVAWIPTGGGVTDPEPAAATEAGG